MKTNVGGYDRIARIVVGAGILSYTAYSGWNWILGIVGAVVLLTGIFKFCGLYTLLGVSTCQIKGLKS